MKSLHFTCCFAFWAFLSLGSCTRIAQESNALSRVVVPFGLEGKKLTAEEVAVSKSVNASYYYLLGEYFSDRNEPEKAIVAYERVKSFDAESPHIHYVLAKEYLKKGMMEEGVALARKAIELDPSHRDAKVLLGNLYATAKKYAEAEELFSGILKGDPDDEEVVLYQVLIDIEQKKLDHAHGMLKKYLVSNPDSELAYFYLGRLEQERERFEEAIAAYEKAIDARPGFVQAGTYLAYIYEKLGRMDKAIETYGWLANSTDNASFHLKLGQVYLDRNDYAQALKALQNYQRVDPGDLNNKVKVGLLYFELKRFEEAAKEFEAVVKESPGSENIQYYLGATYEQSSKYDKALEQFKKIPDSSKLYFEALRRQAGVLVKLNKKSEGWTLLEKQVSEAKAQGKLSEEHFEIAASFLDEVERRDDSLKLLGEGLQHFPASERLTYMKGAVLEKLERSAEAVSEMLKVIRKNPVHAGALNFVGYLWAEQGKNLPEAEKFIRKALKERPDDPFITDSLGWVLHRQGRHKEALAVLEKAHALRPDEAVIAAHLAEVLVKLGRIDEAKKYYELALKLGPERERDRKDWQEKLSRLQDTSKGARVGSDSPKRLRDAHRQPTSADAHTN